MRTALARHGLLAGALLLAVVSVAGGAIYLLGHLTVDDGGTAMRVGVGATLIAAGLALAAGIWLTRRSEHRDRGLLSAGAVPAAVCFWWTGVVPIVAVTVAVSDIRRARRHASSSQSRANDPR